MGDRGARRRARRIAAAGLVPVALLSACGVDIGDTRDRVGSRAYLGRVDAAVEHGGNRIVAGPCSAHGNARVPVSAFERQRDMDALGLPTWRSGDVGVTTSLSDGRVLWVFGDTVRSGAARPKVAANSMLVSSGRCFEEVHTPTKGPVIATSGTDRACWPNSALTIPMRGVDIVVVTCSRVTRGRTGLLDFTYSGLTMSTFAVARGGAPQLVSQRDVVTGGDAQRINWGSALVGHEGWVYVYGSQQPRGSSGKGAYVARCHAAELNDPSRWQYWNGHAFDGDADAARPFLPASEGVSQTFSVVAWKGRFILVSKQGGEFGANVGVWSAPTPHGPWSGTRAVPEPYDQGHGVVAYQPLAHPELTTPSGALLVTMSRTTTRFDDLLAHPERGRPLFLEIPLD